ARCCLCSRSSCGDGLAGISDLRSGQKRLEAVGPQRGLVRARPTELSRTRGTAHQSSVTLMEGVRHAPHRNRKALLMQYFVRNIQRHLLSKALVGRQKIRLARSFVCFPDTSCGGPLQVCHDGLKLAIADRDTFILKVLLEFVEHPATLAYEVRVNNFPNIG